MKIEQRMGKPIQGANKVRAKENQVFQKYEKLKKVINFVNCKKNI